MVYVIKRNGEKSEFSREKIERAIAKAMLETKKGVEEELCSKIAKKMEDFVLKQDNFVTVEELQDKVEIELMSSSRKDVAKRYIIYRSEREMTRKFRKSSSNYRLLTDEFVAKYKHAPSPMNNLGNFVYYRTYSRWLPEEKRREYWWETVRRAVEYNCSLANTTQAEAEELFDNIFHLRQFLSGRTFWVGGTPIAKEHPMSNFNCAFTKVDSISSFKDLFYLLMIGSGVGLRVLKEDVKQLPRIRKNYTLIHESYEAVPKEKRQDNTSLIFTSNDMVKIIVGDSKEGWVQALDKFLTLLSSNDYRNITTIVVNYDNVRPKGEKLKRFGGTASGHESLKIMMSKVDKVLKKASYRDNETKLQLRPIDCLDIANVIGENVVVGGVRRTAEIVIVGAEDKECIEAKSNLYYQENGQWLANKELLHRQMSNNSIYYQEKPSREQLHWQIEQMRYSGEPGFVNAEAASKRRGNFSGVNPCGEILLDSKGMCNLTTVNVLAFVQDGKLDKEKLLRAQHLSARAGYRMTQVEFELNDWNKVHKRDALVGTSLTGWQDMVNATNMSKKDEAKLLKELRKSANEAAESYAIALNSNKPVLVTSLKPEGSLSQLPGVSSGLHYSHSPYFIRRVRINAEDPLVKVCEELGYPVKPEVGQDLNTCNTKVVEFPVKAPQGKTKYEVTAIEQLENYRMFMDNYIDHNASITVHVRDNEWEEVEEWVWNNWDEVVALSFLSLDDSFYDLMPYESITEKEYNKMMDLMPAFIPSLLSKYEKEEQELDVGDESCEAGICPIR